jgi:hypothetical protein
MKHVHDTLPLQNNPSSYQETGLRSHRIAVQHGGETIKMEIN